MRWLTLSILAVAATATAMAHHPDRRSHPPHPYIDVIGPLGTHLPPSHRRKLNRPSKTLGRISYYIAPSSQEAMAWHHAQHRGYYKNHRPRMITQYFYPKPWEALKVGPRKQTTGVNAEDAYPTDGPEMMDMPEAVDVPETIDQAVIDAAISEPIAADEALIEE